jgi:hypothetical protein
MLPFLPRLFLLVIFSGYDTKYALFEKASMVNCSQDFLLHEPKYWCLAWLTTSTFSSAVADPPSNQIWFQRLRYEAHTESIVLENEFFSECCFYRVHHSMANLGQTTHNFICLLLRKMVFQFPQLLLFIV